MYELLKGMTTLMAPILTFTAEEVWRHAGDWEGKEASVHLAGFHPVEGFNLSDDVRSKWELLIWLREVVSKSLELKRADKVIGHSLDAIVDLQVPGAVRKILENDLEGLRYIFIVSQLNLVEELEGEADNYPMAMDLGMVMDSGSEKDQVVRVAVRKSSGKKCERCWHYFGESGEVDSAICSRCIVNLESAKA